MKKGKHRPLPIDLALAIGHNLLAFKMVEQLDDKLVCGELAILRHDQILSEKKERMFTIVTCNWQIRQNCTSLGP